MKCPKCHAEMRAEWVKVGLGRKRLVLRCECKKEEEKKSFSYHRFKDATAFGYDKKTGKPVALDKKGNRIDPKDTRYNFKKDPHGWRSVGMKVRSTDSQGRRM